MNGYHGRCLLLSADRLAAEKSAIEAFKGLSRSVKVSEGDVNLASRVLFDMDTCHGPVLGGAFFLNILGKIFVPIGFGLSVNRNGTKEKGQLNVVNTLQAKDQRVLTLQD